jgi:N-acetylmuramoyl-L-alanine amidase
VAVDLLPATVPPGYAADAFVAVHADRDMEQHWRGYKVAASAISGNPDGSRLLAQDVGVEYAVGSNLPPDVRPDAITPAMRFYYAFNTRSFKHAIAAQVPAAIIETGFVSDPEDRDLLFGNQDTAALALAKGIERFLAEPA